MQTDDLPINNLNVWKPFIELVHYMDEKIILDFIDTNRNDIVDNDYIDEMVVRFCIAIEKRYKVSAKSFLLQLSNGERFKARMTIYQLLT